MMSIIIVEMCAEVSGCNLGDTFASEFAARSQGVAGVVAISLSNNQISDVGLQSLCSKLGGTNAAQHLQQIDLAYNCITSSGAITLARVLQSGSPLEDLNLEGNHIDQSGMHALAEALPKSRLRLLNLSFVSTEPVQLSMWIPALQSKHLQSLEVAQLATHESEVSSDMMMMQSSEKP
jgi:hypothetical protein